GVEEHRLQETIRVRQITVVLPDGPFLILVLYDRAVSGSAPDQLSLLDGVIYVLACLVQPDDVEKVEDIPAFVEHVHGEDEPVGVGRILQRVQRQLIFNFLRLVLVVDHKGLVFREGQLERSEEHTSELQSRFDLVCRLLLEKKKKKSFKFIH